MLKIFKMFLISLLFLPICFAKDLPETKHMRGGIFNWPNALSLQRKIWSSLKVPMISFNSGDINLSKITKELISGQLDFNLSSIIQNMLGSMFNESDSDNYTNDFDEEINEFKYKYSIKNFDSEDPENETKNFCDENLYPNAYLISNFFDGELNIDCKSINDIIGQLLSQVFIIIPLFIIFILSVIFYIVFCFGRCCCCRAKERKNPGVVSIVFFAIIITFIAITIAFSLTSSAYLVKIVNYVFKKDLQKEAENVCELIDPSMKEGMQNTVDKLVPSIENISSKTIETIDFSLPLLMGILNNARDNLTELLLLMKDIQIFTDDSQNNARNKEYVFNTCKNTNGCSQIKDIYLFDEFYDADESENIKQLLDYALESISDIMNITSFVDSGKDSIVDSIDGIKESVRNLENISIINKCEFDEYFEFINDIPSFVVPLISFAIFLIPIIMIVTLIIQIIVFWTKCCCSRCCSACCIPCFACACCQLIIGLLSTLVCILLIFMNLFYQQGDDVFDTLIKEMTNENREIDFGSFNMSSFTDGVIGSFPLDVIRLNKIEFVKNFIDAKLDTPFSEIFSLNQMPINEIANMIEYSFSNASKTTNLDDLIVNPIRNIVNETKSSLPDLDLSEIADINSMEEKLDALKQVISHCSTCEASFDTLCDIYKSFIKDFNKKIDEYKVKRIKLDIALDESPDQVSVYAYDLFGGLLIQFGKSFGSALRTIIPAFNDFDIKWIIGAFNIIRVRFMYNFFVSILCMSIVSHLYIIGMVAMSILLWTRRKGMAKEESSSEGEDSSEESNSKSKSKNNQTENQQPSQSSQSQKRPISSKKKQQIENSHISDSEQPPQSNQSQRKSIFSRKKQQIENSHHSDSEQLLMDSIDDNVDNENKDDQQDLEKTSNTAVLMTDDESSCESVENQQEEEE